MSPHISVRDKIRDQSKNTINNFTIEFDVEYIKQKSHILACNQSARVSLQLDE